MDLLPAPSPPGPWRWLGARPAGRRATARALGAHRSGTDPGGGPRLRVAAAERHRGPGHVPGHQRPDHCAACGRQPRQPAVAAGRDAARGGSPDSWRRWRAPRLGGPAVAAGVPRGRGRTGDPDRRPRESSSRISCWSAKCRYDTMVDAATAPARRRIDSACGPSCARIALAWSRIAGRATRTAPASSAAGPGDGQGTGAGRCRPRSAVGRRPCGTAGPPAARVRPLPAAGIRCRGGSGRCRPLRLPRGRARRGGRMRRT